MASVFFYDEEVDNFKNANTRVQLEVFERDGRIGIALSPANGTTADQLACHIDVEEAKRVVSALNDAITRLKG